MLGTEVVAAALATPTQYSIFVLFDTVSYKAAHSKPKAALLFL